MLETLIIALVRRVQKTGQWVQLKFLPNKGNGGAQWGRTPPWLGVGVEEGEDFSSAVRS